MSVIGFSQIGEDVIPSPSIWGDCPNTLIQDKSLGYFAHDDFLAPVVAASATAATPIGNSNTVRFVGDTDTVLSVKAAEIGGYLDVETDGDDNDGFALVGPLLGRVIPNSGRKLWFETRLELGEIADQGLFVGVAQESALDQDILADDVGALADATLIGFAVLAGDQDRVDAVYRKAGDATVTVVEDASNATSIPLDHRASLAANTEIKLGIRFDGREKLHFYVNGWKVASITVDETIDQATNLAPIVAFKTGTAAARSIAIDWIRYGYQSR